MNKIGVFFIFLFCFSCNQEDQILKSALIRSGKNRQELEKLLAHYKRHKEDSLKLKAARFLIQNMEGHYSYNNPKIEEYNHKIDSLELSFPLRKVMKLALYRYPRIIGEKNKEDDLCFLKADFLIRHIDHVFEFRENCPWLEYISFDDFCEYVLPYRIEHEHPELSKGYEEIFRKKAANLLYTYDDTKYSVHNLSAFVTDTVYTGKMEMNIWKKRFPEFERLEFGCYDEAVKELAIYRGLGIPAAMDFTPFWASWNGAHYWAAPIDRKIKNNSIMQLFRRNVAKVYRRTYSRHDVFVEESGEYIPDLFKNPFLVDVTGEYVNTSDIKVPLQYKPAGKYIYLAVFNDLEWRPVAGSDKREFHNMGREVVYLPVCYKDSILLTLGYPFLLDAKGESHVLKPDTIHLQRMRLNRKYPYEISNERYSRVLIGTYMLGTNDEYFRNCDTLWRCMEDPLMNWCRIKVEKNYRYYRLVPGSVGFVAELEFRDKEGVKISGLWSGDRAYNINYAYDNDALTVCPVFGSLTCDLGISGQVAEIRFLPRNDDNGICAGDIYDLLYMDKDGWKSCGWKVAQDQIIEFDGVPSGALYWLRNRTKGKEERIFTYSEGRVRFW